MAAMPTGIANPVFNGTTAISFNVAQSTSCLVLHANNLTFSEVSVTLEGAEGPTAICSTVDECSNAITSVVKEPVLGSDDIDLIAIDLSPAGVVLDELTKPKFNFKYEGVVGFSPNVTGLHRSAPVPYCEENQLCTGKVVLATQLERTGARRFFPCYDMPAIKARFVTKVTAPVDSAPVILGNMDEASRTTSADGAFVTVEFEPTPIMSTYLVAIAAGDYRQLKGVAAPAGSEYEIRGWTVPGKEEYMAEALRIGYKAFEHYTNEYINVTQPVKKYDFVAFPGKAFAMENWGLLIFDESRALYNASTSGAYGLVRVASVVCHEVAHQWIGNMATAATWNQLMVNEGLASEEEYDCMQYAVPELSADVLRYKVVAPGGDFRSPHEGPLSIAMLLAADSLLPPACPVSDFELNELTVERLVYSKGAATYFMLRYALDMLMGPLGRFWRPTLNKLLLDHQYGTMVYTDIFYTAVSIYGAEYEKRVGPGKEIPVMNWAGGLILRTSQMLPTRGDLAAERAFSVPGQATLTSWAYSPAYPLLDTREPGLVDPTDYLQTLANIGTNQTRFCTYNFTPEEAAEYNLSEEQKLRISTACESPNMFSNVIVMHNLTDCTANKTLDVSTVAGPIDYGPVSADDWVLNEDAVRLWRTPYTDQHFTNLVTEAAQMAACPPERDTTDVFAGSDGICCAAAGDLLETAGVLSDSVAFGQDGTYSVEQTMRMVEAVVGAPVAVTGLGQYLLLQAATEAMEAIRGYSAENATCAGIMDEFQSNLFKPYAQTILDNALNPLPLDAGINKTIGVDGSREALLARLVVSPLLSAAAYVSPNAYDPDNAGGRRRRLLQTEGDAPATAPATAPAAAPAAEAEAPTPTPAAGAPTPNPAPAPAAAAPTPAAAAAAPAAPPAGEVYNNGDLKLQAQLCALLPSTPLWKDYIDYENPSANTSSTVVSPDLLPAIYAVAAAMPPGCRTALEAIYAKTTLAKIPATAGQQEPPYTNIYEGVVHALLDCYYYHPVFAEATRCVYALAGTADPTVLSNFSPDLSSPTFNNIYTMAERKGWMANMLRPWVLANIGKQSTNSYVNLINAFETGGLWEAVGATNGCGTMNILAFIAAPVNMAQVDALDTIINGKLEQCPPNLRARLQGKALVARKNAARTQQQVCAYLDDWQARQQQRKRR